MNTPRFETFPREDGDYGWHFRDANGRITVTAGEGFTRREDAHRAITSHVEDIVRATVPHADAMTVKPPPVVDVDEPDRN
jgi:uncharacterized protein YegP (UPF0339 family)